MKKNLVSYTCRSIPDSVKEVKYTYVDPVLVKDVLEGRAARVTPRTASRIPRPMSSYNHPRRNSAVNTCQIRFEKISLLIRATEWPSLQVS